MTTFPKRNESEICPIVATAPPPACAQIVAAHDAPASAKNGTFSISNSPQRACRFSGQQSTSSSTQGSVTTIGLLNNPSANVIKATTSHRHCPRSTYVTYASNVSIQNNPDSTSLRSAIHATDSTCCGCSAKIP